MKNKGQALVEWIVFATGMLILWTGALALAGRLLERTVSETWGLLSARQALSKANLSLPPGVRVQNTQNKSSAHSRVITENAVTHSQIEVPQPGKGGLLEFSSWFSGSLFSLFSE